MYNRDKDHTIIINRGAVRLTAAAAAVIGLEERDTESHSESKMVAEHGMVEEAKRDAARQSQALLAGPPCDSKAFRRRGQHHSMRYSFKPRRHFPTGGLSHNQRRAEARREVLRLIARPIALG